MNFLGFLVLRKAKWDIVNFSRNLVNKGTLKLNEMKFCIAA
jgi:hypothetical protein